MSNGWLATVKPTCDVLILTALGVEYQAVMTYLSATQEIIHSQGTIYQQGNFSDHSHTWKIAVAEIGMGGSGAALETERAIHFFQPKILFFVGIAPGLKDVQLGDVVAATKIYNYEAGKADIHFQARPEVWRSSYALEQRARVEGRSMNWLARMDKQPSDALPRVFVGALAAGEKLIASKQAGIYRFLRTTYGDALAVEMEGHGFLQAVRANQAVQALVIRGVSDLFDDKTGADRENAQIRAARHAAAFAFEVLAKFNAPEFADSESKNVSPVKREAVFLPSPSTAPRPKDPARVRQKIFISYSHNDARWLERLRVHLAPVEREGNIDLWDDTKIAIGSLWQASIQEALASARVAITLVSADFLASKFIVEYELPRLLARAASDGLTILPIIVSPCLFSSSELGVFQAANAPDKPLSGMTKVEREQALVNLAKHIRKSFMGDEI